MDKRSSQRLQVILLFRYSLMRVKKTACTLSLFNINSRSSSILQLLFLFDQDMRVEKILVQTLACPFSYNSCSRLTRTWEFKKLSYKLSLVTYQQLSCNSCSWLTRSWKTLTFELSFLFDQDYNFSRRSLQQSGKQYINQFPSENVLTCKDLLARVVNRVGLLYPERCDSPGSTRPPWFQESYNLNVELSQFIHNFRKREERWGKFIRPGWFFMKQ